MHRIDLDDENSKPEPDDDDIDGTATKDSDSKPGTEPKDGDFDRPSSSGKPCFIIWNTFLFYFKFST